LHGIKEPLQFTGPVLANIYLEKIKKWNDPELAKLNPGVPLPDQDILTVHRSDGSGTTYIWVDYLSKVSPAEWKPKVGVGVSVNWPGGVASKGNEGVAGTVSQSPGAIGYVELIYAIQHQATFAAVRNRAGHFIRASLESVNAAGEGQALGASITDPRGAGAYPIASFTWLLVPDPPGEAETDLLRWILTTGQKSCSLLGYAPLPGAVAKEALSRLP